MACRNRIDKNTWRWNVNVLLTDVQPLPFRSDNLYAASRLMRVRIFHHGCDCRKDIKLTDT
ncbi:hypothetical protein CFBP2533_11480 [Xanthomonas hortorum pv. pelargonii]|uniref:Uncharacterized protein n=1 Tax=Xanthomonas hortorum pv. pelargonii TaxID=453602 RepID=A0A6V7CAS2_9XANT|nr:hypothetical protein CFBP2533_11480 [Xanthomonas hortorum pv. pelargonii]CAD0313158.1 hypothetical protein CFBP2533_11480 [Xanthomonas hortorum pv. pelargonii]